MAALFAHDDLAARYPALLADYPDLSASGFTDDDQRPSVAHVARCCEYLYEEAPRMDHRASSYAIKHDVERWHRVRAPKVNAYVSNGAMIAALLMAGYALERADPNALVRLRPTSYTLRWSGGGVRSSRVAKRTLSQSTQKPAGAGAQRGNVDA